MRIFFRRLSLYAITMVVAMAAAFSCAAGDDVTLPQPDALSEQITGTGSFSSRLVTVQDELIARVYKASLQERYAGISGAEQIAESTYESAKTAKVLPYSFGQIAEGEYAGRWQFIAPKGGVPTLAWREIDRSSAKGYDAERIGYCRGKEKSCNAWFEAGRHLSRAPDQSAGMVALAEWRNRVMEEPCKARSEYRPSQARMQAAIASSGMDTAEVFVTVLTNPCGDVRQASIAKSSRRHIIDHAALEWVSNARFPETSKLSSGRGTLGIMPFTFIAVP